LQSEQYISLNGTGNDHQAAFLFFIFHPVPVFAETHFGSLVVNHFAPALDHRHYRLLSHFLYLFD
jgi:hypothetical protein